MNMRRDPLLSPHMYMWNRQYIMTIIMMIILLEMTHISLLFCSTLLLGWYLYVVIITRGTGGWQAEGVTQ
jgi:hypothetical protein